MKRQEKIANQAEKPTNEKLADFSQAKIIRVPERPRDNSPEEQERYQQSLDELNRFINQERAIATRKSNESDEKTHLAMESSLIWLNSADEQRNLIRASLEKTNLELQDLTQACQEKFDEQALYSVDGWLVDLQAPKNDEEAREAFATAKKERKIFGKSLKEWTTIALITAGSFHYQPDKAEAQTYAQPEAVKIDKKKNKENKEFKTIDEQLTAADLAAADLAPNKKPEGRSVWRDALREYIMKQENQEFAGNQRAEYRNFIKNYLANEESGAQKNFGRDFVTNGLSIAMEDYGGPEEFLDQLEIIDSINPGQAEKILQLYDKEIELRFKADSPKAKFFHDNKGEGGDNFGKQSYTVTIPKGFGPEIKSVIDHEVVAHIVEEQMGSALSDANFKYHFEEQSGEHVFQTPKDRPMLQALMNASGYSEADTKYMFDLLEIEGKTMGAWREFVRERGRLRKLDGNYSVDEKYSEDDIEKMLTLNPYDSAGCEEMIELMMIYDNNVSFNNGLMSLRILQKAQADAQNYNQPELLDSIHQEIDKIHKTIQYLVKNFANEIEKNNQKFKQIT